MSFAVESSVASSSSISDEETWLSSGFNPRDTVVVKRRLSSEITEHRSQSLAACLPSELILEIFKLLSSPKDLYSTLLTCQSWCACTVELLWYKPILYTAPSLLRLLSTLKKEDLTFEYPTFIRRLNLSYLTEQISDSILLKLQPCRKLERLTLGNCRRVSDRGLCDILSRNSGLIALDLSNVEEITDLPILVAASRNKELQGLNLTGCVKITDDAIVSIAASCQHLRRVRKRAISFITTHTDEV